jgi:hypothetical protein
MISDILFEAGEEKNAIGRRIISTLPNGQRWTGVRADGRDEMETRCFARLRHSLRRKFVRFFSSVSGLSMKEPGTALRKL